MSVRYWCWCKTRCIEYELSAKDTPWHIRGEVRYYLSYVFEFEVWSKLVVAVLYAISREIAPCNNGIRLHTWLFIWRKYTRCGIFHDTFVCKFDDILLFWSLCFCTAIHSELQTREGEIQHVVWPMKFEAKENIRFRRHATFFRIIGLLRGESIGHRNYKKWEIRMCYGRCYLKHGKSETWLHKHPCYNMRLAYLKLHSSSLVYKRPKAKHISQNMLLHVRSTLIIRVLKITAVVP